jgi:hypothetical protein
MLKKKRIFFEILLIIPKYIYLCPQIKLKQKTQQMKKVLSIVAVAALSAAFVACGPSKEEIEAKEKAKADSIAAVEKQKTDSIAAAEAAMAEQNAMAEKAKADSTAMADSLAKAAEKGGKKK